MIEGIWRLSKEEHPESHRERCKTESGNCGCRPPFRACFLGTIPTDNAACFLRHAGYAPIVPGQCDFYFGPDRLRQLARLLASETEGAFRPVQMLGANLVIETTWKNDHNSVGDTEDPPGFAPWSAAKFAKGPDAPQQRQNVFLGVEAKSLVEAFVWARNRSP
jgi:hypothetical protein